jgi:translation initiation factor IF-3
VRVIGDEGQQLGVMPLGDAIALARPQPGRRPRRSRPQCRPSGLPAGRLREVQVRAGKRQKENRKHHHANKVKEIQLSATIDPHDFQTN